MTLLMKGQCMAGAWGSRPTVLLGCAQVDEWFSYWVSQCRGGVSFLAGPTISQGIAVQYAQSGPEMLLLQAQLLLIALEVLACSATTTTAPRTSTRGTTTPAPVLRSTLLLNSSVNPSVAAQTVIFTADVLCGASNGEWAYACLLKGLESVMPSRLNAFSSHIGVRRVLPGWGYQVTGGSSVRLSGLHRSAWRSPCRDPQYYSQILGRWLLRNCIGLAFADSGPGRADNHQGPDHTGTYNSNAHNWCKDSV